MMEIKLNKRLQRRPRWLIILVIIIVLGGFIGIKTLNQQYLPVDSNNKEPVEIYIPAESSARQIAAILYENISSNNICKLSNIFNGIYIQQVRIYTHKSIILGKG